MRLAMSLIGIMVAAILPAQAGDDPLLRPIAPDFASRWLTPKTPERLFGSTYFVGFGGLSVALIDTKDGLILIDGAVPQAVPMIEENIRQLGFSLRDIKLILSTEPHYDHAGGLAALARDTGATVVASPEGAKVLEAGRSGPDDPQFSWLPPFPAVRGVRVAQDGDTITLGDTTVTAVATPGHTAGSMSWAWQSCEGKRCANVVFASSLNPVAPDDYRFSDSAHQEIVEAYGRSFARMRAVPCDILITAHPDQPAWDAKLARLGEQPEANPFIDPKACAAYAEASAQRLADRLKQEGGAGEEQGGK